MRQNNWTNINNNWGGRWQQQLARLQPLVRWQLVEQPSVRSLALAGQCELVGRGGLGRSYELDAVGLESADLLQLRRQRLLRRRQRFTTATSPSATVDQYIEQAQAIATSIPPDVQPAAEDWLPLGVFAITQDGESANDEPTMFLQLAVSKQGIIAGMFQNTTSGVTKSVEGMVDKETQRAAWTAEGESRPLMETGIGNLTQDTAGVLVHFANGDTQRWLLARLNNPQQPASAKK